MVEWRHSQSTTVTVRSACVPVLVALAVACGEPAAPAPPAPLNPEHSASAAAPDPVLALPPAEAVPQEAAAPSEEPVEAEHVPSSDDPWSRPLAGDIYWIGDEDTRAVFLEIDPSPQPEGDVVGSIGLHHAHRDLRLIDEVTAPERVVIVDRTHLCEARVRRARRMHTLLVPDNNEGLRPSDPRTYLVLNFAGCRRGTAGISGVARADIRVRSLRFEALTRRPTREVLQAVRQLEGDNWGDTPPPASEFRMLELPAHGVTFVVGEGAWVVRHGVALSGAAPITLIEAGPLVLLELETASETWLGTLADFGPVYAPRGCEVIDDSGTSMNIRAAPRGNANVVTTLATGAHITADGVSGAWLHLATTPPGWAHQRGLRCEPPGQDHPR